MDLSKFSRGGGDFEPAPAGVHNAVCVAVVDLGTQETSFEGKARLTPQVMLRWEIDERMEDGRRFLVTRRFTQSMHEKAGLRKVLEAWRGVPFKEADFAPGGFNMRKLLGAGCQIQIVHIEKDGKTFANIAAVMKLGKGMAPLTPEIEPYMVDLTSPETFDRESFNALSDAVQEVVAKSPEFQAIIAATKKPNGSDRSGKRQPGGMSERAAEVVHTDDLDDEIPFELPLAA